MRVWPKLDDFQQDAVQFVVPRKSSALFFEQGTGKTWITVGVIERLLTGNSTFLIVVPLTNYESTWLATLRKQLPRLSVCTTWDAYNAAEGDRALVIHYEAAPALVARLRRRRWTLIVYDESQRLKDRATIQSRTAAKLRNSADHKMILSGTPIEQNPKDVWAQFRFVAPDVFGTRWKDFEEEFLEEINIDLSQYKPGSFRFKQMLRALQIRKNKRKFRPEMMPEFLRRVKPVALRVTKEVLDLPPINTVPVPVVLRGDQRRVYEELERDLVSRVRSARITAPLRVTQLGKLQQVCGGYVFDDDGEIHEVGRAKIRAVKMLMRRIAKPVVIFCRYREEVWSIHDELVDDYRVETLTGLTKKKIRPNIIRRFQDGELDVLICQQRTGGVGIDLFRARNAIVYSMTYSYIDFDQMKSRIHRRGQEFETNLFLIFARGTIDEDVFAAILSKRKVAETVLTRLRKRRKVCPESVRRKPSRRRASSSTASRTSRI